MDIQSHTGSAVPTDSPEGMVTEVDGVSFGDMSAERQALLGDQEGDS